MKVQTIDKLDAARRQLNTAITLWFSNGDEVAIHTLVCSAYQIVHDINQERGGEELLYDSVIWKDEYRKQIINLLKRHYNFFKHADKDPSGTTEFNPRLSELFMLITSKGLAHLGLNPDKVQEAFILYYCLHNPQHVTEKGRKVLIDPFTDEHIKDLLNIPKPVFFEAYTHFQKKNPNSRITIWKAEKQR